MKRLSLSGAAAFEYQKTVPQAVIIPARSAL
jgi:hypothetical protein